MCVVPWSLQKRFRASFGGGLSTSEVGGVDLVGVSWESPELPMTLCPPSAGRCPRAPQGRSEMTPSAGFPASSPSGRSLNSYALPPCSFSHVKARPPHYMHDFIITMQSKTQQPIR